MDFLRSYKSYQLHFFPLRKGFIPEDNMEEMKDKDKRPEQEKPLKEKLPPSAEQEETTTKPIAKVECQKCGEKLEPFYMRTHHCEGTD